MQFIKISKNFNPNELALAIFTSSWPIFFVCIMTNFKISSKNHEKKTFDFHNKYLNVFI